MERLRIHFVGTGTSTTMIRTVITFGHTSNASGWSAGCDEHPNRIGYVDVLNHLAHASAILILGSTEAHYTPSKVYQAVQAKRPIFALLARTKHRGERVARKPCGPSGDIYGGEVCRDAEELAAIRWRPSFAIRNIAPKQCDGKLLMRIRRATAPKLWRMRSAAR